MNFITSIMYFLAPTIARQNQQVTILQQEIQQATQQYQEEAIAKRSLLKEIEYMYSLLIHKNGHRFQLHILPNLPPILLTVGTQKDKTVLALYVPSDCIEIASVTTRLVDQTMVIETLIPNDSLFERKKVCGLFMQQIILEARRQQVDQITDMNGQAVVPVYQEASRLSELLGISVITNS